LQFTELLSTKKTGIMRTAITATANEKTKTYDITKTWSDGTSVTYRTAELTDQEFEDLEYNTSIDWQNFLETNMEYYLIKEEKKPAGEIKRSLNSEFGTSNGDDNPKENTEAYHKAMEATTIAHLVGRMDVILKLMEFNASQIEVKDHQTGFLVKLLKGKINEAKDVNEKIFEMHKKNELDRIEKIYNDESE
jgi:hypothetical protein